MDCFMIVCFKSECFLACSSWWDLSLLAATFSTIFDFIYLWRNNQHSGEYWWKAHVDVLPRFTKTKMCARWRQEQIDVSCGFWLWRRNPGRFSLPRLTLSFFTFSSFRGTKDPALILSVNDIVDQWHKSQHKSRFLRIFNFSVIFAEFSLCLRLGVIMRVCKV